MLLMLPQAVPASSALHGPVRLMWLECGLKYRVSIHPLYLGLNRTDGEASVGRSAAVCLLFCLNVERILKPKGHRGDFTTYWGPCVSPEAVCLLLRSICVVDWKLFSGRCNLCLKRSERSRVGCWCWYSTVLKGHAGNPKPVYRRRQSVALGLTAKHC